MAEPVSPEPAAPPPPFEWWTDTADHLWTRHHCGTTTSAYRLPPPWHVTDHGGVAPSLQCRVCFAHVTVGAAERIEAPWNWMIPMDDLCVSCDGKPAPEPDCEGCHGTGIDTGWRDARRAPVGVVDTPPPTDTRIETGTHIDGRLIEDLADLPTGWDGYEAERLTEEALDVLRCVIVTPTTQGGFQIEWHTIDEDFEVEVGADGRVINDEDDAGVHRG